MKIMETKMKHQIYAVAAMATLSGAALAQSNVTTYGSFDGGLRNLTNVNPGGDSVLTMGSNGTYRSNRLGFKGSEALGDGLTTNFVLEAGFNSGTGALNNTNGILFQREAHVGVAGQYGALDVGRNYTVAYRTILAFDPFGYRYPSITYALSSTAGTRKDNDVQYTGKFGDFTARAAYSLGEVAGSTDSGSTRAVGGVYASGPVRLAAEYTTAKPKNGAGATAAYRDFTHYAVGGAYSIGAATATVGYVKQKQETTTIDDTSEWNWAGLSYRLAGGVSLTGAWYRVKAVNSVSSATIAAGNSKKSLYMTGITYDLSKRTVLYSEVDVTKLDGGYATGGTTKLNQARQTGVSAGINHMF
jgi:predicted porin